MKQLIHPVDGWTLSIRMPSLFLKILSHVVYLHTVLLAEDIFSDTVGIKKRDTETPILKILIFKKLCQLKRASGNSEDAGTENHLNSL